VLIPDYSLSQSNFLPEVLVTHEPLAEIKLKASDVSLDYHVRCALPSFRKSYVVGVFINSPQRADAKAKQTKREVAATMPAARLDSVTLHPTPFSPVCYKYLKHVATIHSTIRV
jgi:hypothetical protein